MGLFFVFLIVIERYYYINKSIQRQGGEGYVYRVR